MYIVVDWGTSHIESVTPCINTAEAELERLNNHYKRIRCDKVSLIKDGQFTYTRNRRNGLVQLVKKELLIQEKDLPK